MIKSDVHDNDCVTVCCGVATATVKPNRHGLPYFTKVLSLISGLHDPAGDPSAGDASHGAAGLHGGVRVSAVGHVMHDHVPHCFRHEEL